MVKTARQLDKEIAAITAGKYVDAIHHALYRSKDPDALIDAVRDAQKHVSAMKRVARKPPKHPGSSALVDSRGEFDPKMYELVNLLVDAKKYVKNISKQRSR
jgi:hypothetical protein